ncbi:hypothetical protein ABPG75_012104 [Micractinium tetrahymenae]
MHIRFADDDDEAPGPSAAAPQHAAPHASFAGSQNFCCASTVRVDFDQKDQCYVFELAHSPGADLVAAALSNRRIKLFNFGEGGLQFVGDLVGHEGMLQEVHFCLPDQPALLHSCAADGTVRGWDARSGQQVESYTVQRLELLSCSTNGTLVAAGGGDKVLFWDRRTQRPIASFDDTHCQDVTQVAFHPAHRGMLVSGSEDGLIAVFDTAPGLDEDEGFKAALNIDTSVAKLGFYGRQGEKLWARSGVESLHLWEWAAACNDEAAGGNGALGEALNAREQLTAAAASCAVGQALAPGVDYLVGCEYNAASDKLWLLAGNNAGAVGFFPVVEPPALQLPSDGGAGAAQPAAGMQQQQQQQQQQQALFGAPQAALAGGGGAHADIVRSVLWPGAAGGMCLSGGEDSKVCVWSLQPVAAAAGPSAAAAQRPSGSSSGGGSGALRKHHQPHSQQQHQHHQQRQRRGAPY